MLLRRYNLGILYECCNQLNDATDAYRTAAVLAPTKSEPRQRLLAAQRQKQAQQLQQIQTTPYYNFQSPRASQPVMCWKRLYRYSMRIPMESTSL